MALITIRISDETLLKYGSYEPESPEHAIERQLEKFKDHNPGERLLIVTGEKLAELEKALGQQVEDAKQLIKVSTEMLRLKIGEAKVMLSEWQRKRLEQYANHQRKDPTAYLEEVTKQALKEKLGAS